MTEQAVSHGTKTVIDTLHGVASHAQEAAHGVVSSGGHGAAAAAGGHGASMGDILLHHLTDISSWEIFFIDVSFTRLQIELFGINMSVNKAVLFLWLAGAVLLLSFSIAFRGGKLLRNKFAHLLEVYILFIRDEVVYPIIGAKDGRPLMPFFLTVFFFILTLNLLGLLPWGHTATANINVTAGLAIIAFIAIQGMGIAKNGFVGHCKALLPGGLPAFVIPIMIPVEIVGMLAKPFALCIRLFANMVAGHAVILVLLLLIIQSGSYIIAPLPVFGILFIMCLELFVAHLQAFIFTILTTLFMSMTMHPSH